jgi:alpha-D-ribose 1-methylphosphonate 5-triphosphate diphosphatase
MTSFAVTNATVVLPDRILEGGAVVVQDGRIAEVLPSAPRTTAPGDVDAAGAYVMPGLIDVHNDGLEFEIRPRPTTTLPLALALSTFERRLAGAGVTTVFHAIAFMNRSGSAGGVPRTTSDSFQRATAVAAWRGGGRAIDHQVLHRIDVWAPEHLDLVFEAAGRFPLRYVSLNDHTPGQGQYRDIDKYVATLNAYADQRGTKQADVESLHRIIAERAADQTPIAQVHARVLDEAGTGSLLVATHDDDSPEKVDLGAGLGAGIAEFPVTVEAAKRARERGLTIVVGAPNIVRGGSSSGNLDARELFSLGLADVICADYHAPSMLPAAFRVVEEGLTDLPFAIRTLTQNAARAVGLTDRGAVEVGLQADLLLVRLNAEGLPQVEKTYRAGRLVHAFTSDSATALDVAVQEKQRVAVGEPG